MAAAAGQPLPHPDWLGGPSNLRARGQAPLTGPLTASQQTPAQSFREGFEDFGTHAADAATLGFSDNIVGGLGMLQGKPYERGRDEQRGRLAAADERSPGASLGGQIFGGLVAPGATGGLARQATANVVGGVGASDADLARVKGRTLIPQLVESAALSLAPSGPKTARPVGRGVRPRGVSDTLEPVRDYESIVKSHMGKAKASDKAGGGGVYVPRDLPPYPYPEHWPSPAGNKGHARNYGKPGPAPAPLPPTKTIDDVEGVLAWAAANNEARSAIESARAAAGLPASLPSAEQSLDKLLGLAPTVNIRGKR